MLSWPGWNVFYFRISCSPILAWGGPITRQSGQARNKWIH